MEELNSGPPKTNPSSGREGDLKPGPPDYKSSALTTRPRYLHSNCARLQFWSMFLTKPNDDNNNNIIFYANTVKIRIKNLHIFFEVLVFGGMYWQFKLSLIRFLISMKEI